MAGSVAVVVATRDRPALLHDALAALARSRRAPDRVVVVDSASTDPAVATTARAAGAVVVRAERPGTSRARNLGTAAVSEEIVAFLDDDCLADPGWIGALLAAFDDPSAPAFVTGQVRPEAAGEDRRVWLTLSAMTDAVPRRLAAPDDPATFGHGANMAWRRDDLVRLGGFDEQLGPGTPLRAAEDLDLLRRAVHAGLTGRYAPDAVVVHREWRSRRAMLATYHAYGVGAGAVALKEVHQRMSSVDGRERADGSVGAALRMVVAGTLVSLVRSVRARHEMAALADAAKLVGAVRGITRARRLAVVDGRFSSMPSPVQGDEAPER